MPIKKTKTLKGGEVDVYRYLTPIGNFNTIVKEVEAVEAVETVETEVNNFIDYLNTYNDSVDHDNTSFIKTIESRRDGGGNRFYMKGGNSLTEIEKNEKIEELLDRGNIEQIFKLIKLKTKFYWYDDVKLEKCILKQFLNFLFKKRISQNKVVPTDDVWKYEYFKDVHAKFTEIGIHRDDANLETLFYRDKIETRFVFNNHPFSSLKYIDLNNIHDSKEYNENGYVWFIKNNTVSIYKNYSKDKLQEIIKSKLEKWFKAEDDYKLQKLKMVMNHHPYLFYIDYESDEINKISKLYSNFKEIIDFNSTPVVIQQGRHGLCWLCSILNAIYYYFTIKTLQLDDVNKNYKNLIQNMLSNLSVLEFIKGFEIEYSVRIASLLHITNEGGYINAIKRILTMDGIVKISSNITIDKKEKYTIISFIEWRGHSVFCANSRIYDSRIPYLYNIDVYDKTLSNTSDYRLSLNHIKNDELTRTIVTIRDVNGLKKYFAYQSGGGKSLIKRYLQTLYKCPDGRIRKAFRIQGNGNTIFVTVKNNIVKAKSIPTSKRV